MQNTRKIINSDNLNPEASWRTECTIIVDNEAPVNRSGIAQNVATICQIYHTCQLDS